MSIKISASTNPPPLNQLFAYIKKLNTTNIDYIHCDVMDGYFVKAKTFSHKTVKKIKAQTSKKLDVHLMVKNLGSKIKKYVKAGADILTVHFEAFKNKNKLIKTLQKIRSFGCFAGLSFNPNTSVLDILPFVAFCDLILVMSVVPGKSGQEFMTESLTRIDTLNKFLKKQKLDVVIEIDGGVNSDNISSIVDRKIDIAVVGNYLYKSNDLEKTVNQLKDI